MNTLEITKWGKINITDTADSKPARDEVIIDVIYAGVGFADVLAVHGAYLLAPRRPFSPGYEFLGIVEVLGDDVSHLRIGQRVCGMLPLMGAYKKSLRIKAVWAVSVPDNVSDETAALLPLNYMTAMALIEKKGDVKRGDKILIQGAAGGVGTAVLELAKQKGITVYGTASPVKHDIVRELGGIPVNYKQKNWTADFKRMLPEGVDFAFDAFGIKAMNQCWKVLNKRGTLVSYGFSPEIKKGHGPMIKGFLSLMLKKLFGFGKKARVCGTPAIIRKDPLWYKNTMEYLLGLASKGDIKPILYKKFNWREARDAHNEIIESKARGKMLLAFSVNRIK